VSVTQRLRKLEAQEYERQLYAAAQHIARKYGEDLDAVVRSLREVTARIDRWGIEAEHRRVAQEYGITFEEVERRYGEIVREGL